MPRQPLYLVAIATTAVVGSAYAQSPGIATSDADSGALQEIVVTANRVAQDLQKVSAAVLVVDGDALAKEALTNVSQIFQSTPSVQITGQPEGFSVDIRGQGADLPSGLTQGAVATEFDGIYNITSLAAQVGFFDVDRIEVLPGPQSTRYGPNADGGVVNIISKDPTFGSFDGRGTLTIGDYGLRRGEIAQNFALGDQLAIRVSGAAIDRNSYFKPSTSNAIAQSGRVKLLYQPTDNLRIKLQVQVDHTGGTGNGSEPRFISTQDQYPSDAINTPSYACTVQPTYSGLNCANPWNHGNTADSGNPLVPNSWNHSDLTETTYVGVVSYSFDNGAVLDVTPSYINGSGHQDFCYAGGPPGQVGGAFTCYRNYPFSPFKESATEVRLHSAPGSKITWSVGYYHWNYDNTSWSDIDPILGTDPNGGGPSQNTPGPIGGGANGVKTDAVFGDLIYPVTDSFRAIVGLRRSKDTRSNRNNDETTVFSASTSHVDYRVGEEFDLSPSTMQYLTIATGYRPGLISTDGATGLSSLLQSEVITSYELGLKGRFLDNRLQINSDLFFYNEKNYQELDFYGGGIVTLRNPYTSQGGGPGPPGPPVTYPAGASYQCQFGPNPPECTNPSWAAKAYILGFETQIRFNATRDDRFSLNATYLDAKFNSGQTNCAIAGAPTTPGCWYGYNPPGQQAPTFVDIAGASQPHSPKLAGNLGYNHTFHLGAYALDVGADAFYTTGYWVHPSEDLELHGWQPSYWMENLSANLAPTEGIWSVNAFIRNLNNYAVKESYVPATTIGDPRTYGLSLNLKW